MKLKYELTEMEIADKFPGLLKMREEILAAGDQCYIQVVMETEVTEAANQPPQIGRCSKCGRPVVEVRWPGESRGVKMEYSGLACRHCGYVLEYAGFNAEPFDLTEWFKGRFSPPGVPTNE